MHLQSPRPGRSPISLPDCDTRDAIRRSWLCRTARALLLAPTALLCAPACSAPAEVDDSPLAAYRAAVVAHELGHAIGLGHTARGLMQPSVPPRALPQTSDWRDTGYVDCVNWSVPTDLRPAFEAAAEAWCVASDGHFCPWINDAPDEPCQVQWSDLPGTYIGYWTEHLIQVDPSLQ